MHDLIRGLVESSALVINMMAFIVIWIGTIEAFAKVVCAIFQAPSAPQVFRPIWSRYARWLVAGLTFQLAADIIETSLTPSWNDIGRLAAIAVVRTFLNYFLARDMAEMAEFQEGSAAPSTSK